MSFNPLVTVTAVISPVSVSAFVKVIVGAVVVPPNASVPSIAFPSSSNTTIDSPTIALDSAKVNASALPLEPVKTSFPFDNAPLTVTALNDCETETIGALNQPARSDADAVGSSVRIWVQIVPLSCPSGTKKVCVNCAVTLICPKLRLSCFVSPPVSGTENFPFAYQKY